MIQFRTFSHQDKRALTFSKWSRYGGVGATILILIFGSLIIANWVRTDTIIGERSADLQNVMKRLAENSERIIAAIEDLNPGKLRLEVLENHSGMISHCTTTYCNVFRYFHILFTHLTFYCR